MEIGLNPYAVDVLELSLFEGTFALRLDLGNLLLVHLLIKLYDCISQIEIPHLHLMSAILFALE